MATKTDRRYKYPLTDKDKATLIGEMFTLKNWGIEQVELLVEKEGVKYSRLVNPAKDWERLNRE